MRRALLIGVVLTVLLVLATGLGVGYAIWRMAPNLPSLPTDPRELGIRPGTEMYTASGERIYTFNQSRQWVPLEHISPYVVKALIATEDAHFYHHRGIDLTAIVGALRDNLRKGSLTRGGSTLTQQLVKRLFFSPEKTFERKLSEALLAVQLEAFFAASYPDTNAAGQPAYKDRLLELYLNEVFYGTNAYGIHDAAVTFFNTTPDSLSLPRAAMLIGQINAPTAYNPLRHPQRATTRMQHVLDRLVASGFLDPATRWGYAALRTEDLIEPGYPPRNPVPYWVEAINAEIVRQWGPSALHYGSLKVYTTLDIAMQEAAEEAVAKGMVELDERLGFKPYSEASMAERPAYVQGALVCLSPTGNVLAMVGGRDIFVSYYNRALTARRQPGSGFKPMAYLAALEAGEISPVTVFNDQPHTYIVNGQKWEPRNYGGRYLGQTTVGLSSLGQLHGCTNLRACRPGPRRRDCPPLGVCRANRGLQEHCLGRCRSHRVGNGHGVRNFCQLRIAGDADLDRAHRRYRRPVDLYPSVADPPSYRARPRRADGPPFAPNCRPRHRPPSAHLGLCAASRRQDRHDQRQYRRLVHRLHTGLSSQRLGGVRRPPHP